MNFNLEFNRDLSAWILKKLEESDAIAPELKEFFALEHREKIKSRLMEFFKPQKDDNLLSWETHLAVLSNFSPSPKAKEKSNAGVKPKKDSISTDKKITEILIRQFSQLLSLSHSINWNDKKDKDRVLMDNILKKFHLEKSAPKSISYEDFELFYLNSMALFTVSYFKSQDVRFFNAALFAFDSMAGGKSVRSEHLKLAAVYLKLAALLFGERTAETGFHPLPLGYN